MTGHILFDLDGTLTDPGVGITRSVQYALRRFGIEVEDLRQLHRFVGPPLNVSFMEYYGMTQHEAARAIDAYREYYTETGMFENLVYPGIPELLAELQGTGKALYVATSKPEVYARQILDYFGLTRYFRFIAGPPLAHHGFAKADVIRRVLGENALTPAGAVMVGDREHDVLGARENGMDCIGVLFGYGSREELEAAGACAIVGDVNQLGQLLLAG